MKYSFLSTLRHIFSSFDRIPRRNFLSLSATILAFSSLCDRYLSPLFGKERILKPRPGKKVRTRYDLVAAVGNDPYKNTRNAVTALGGMNRFVKRGDVVVIKPNIGWNNTPEYAVNTNPDVVRALVEMCKEAGAKQVRVFDNTCNTARMCYKNSGIEAAVIKAGGSIYHVSDWKFYKTRFPKGSKMDDWPLFRDAIECDVFINVPVAKHHGLTGLTLSIKNLMGICGGMRGMMHWSIDQKLAELLAFVKPDLTIVDAYRVLLRNGPSGGRLGDVSLKKTVIASADPVLADAYAARLMRRKPEGIGYIKRSAQMKLGSMNLQKAKIKQLQV